MQLQQAINPIKIARGYIANSTPDWSQTGSNVLSYNFNNAGTTTVFRQVAGMWVDNSRNTNSLAIQVMGTQQYMVVYGGEVCTFPIFTTDYPNIVVTNNNDVTPNVGTTQFIFTSFDIGYNIAQTGSGASIIVSDTNLLALFNSVLTGATGVAKTTGLSVSPVTQGTTWVTQQVVLVAGSQTLLANNTHNRFWNIQNISADPVYISIGPTVTASATNGSYKLAAGASLNSNMLADQLFTNVIAICPTNTGDTVNIQYC